VELLAPDAITVDRVFATLIATSVPAGKFPKKRCHFMRMERNGRNGGTPRTALLRCSMRYPKH